MTEKRKKTLGELVKEAVSEMNAHKAGKVADFLRFRNGFNYKDVYEFAHKVTGVSECDWETLMYEADSTE